MLFPLAWSLATREPATAAFATSAGICVAFGLLLWRLTPLGEGRLSRREAVLIVAGGWVLASLFGTLPYVLSGTFPNYLDACFEAVSGFTTTGATVLTSIETQLESILLWRSITQWLGGMGIVTLFVALFPILGIGAAHLVEAEMPGTETGRMTPRIRDTAKAVWMMYLGFTALELIMLLIAGLPPFHALTVTFSTMPTGGFTGTDLSIAAFNSVFVEGIVIFFTMMAGVNFGIYYNALRGKWRGVLRDPELRAYLGLLVVASAIIVACLWENYFVTTAGHHAEPSLGAAVRHGVFQTVAIQTTTGFCTANFDLWPFLPKAVLVTLMFIGGSGGSTGGGIKIEHIFRPSVGRTIRLGPTAVDPELRQSVLAYVLIILLLFGAGTGILMLLETGAEIDITTAATASAATLNNIGPGLARVGAIENFAWFTAPSKVVMTVLMALGRLEVFAILVLFMPRFWKGD